MADSVVEELARKRLGRTIKGKWRLDRLIGVGGMAAVYAATHRNGARVAIKMLHPTISASQQIRARFVREGYLANKVDHPGVVRVLDDDIDDQDHSAFLVMDLVIGATLSDRAMERLLDDREVLDVAEQVLSVLASAHKQGIVHRDLKPDNLLVDRAGKVHVLDFGIARLLDDATGGITATKTGTAFGTPGFMAPEQALGRTSRISAKTDLYSLGATLFALVSGDFVHAAENPQELMVMVATQPARSLAEVAPHMHADVIALIDRATRNEAERRWPSAEAMLEEVKRVKARVGTATVLPLSAPITANAAPSDGAIQLESGDLQSAPPAPNTLGSPHPAPPVVASTPAPFGDVGSAGLSSMAPTPLPARRPRFMPVALIGGAALLLVVVAVVVAATRSHPARTATDDDHTTNASGANATTTASAKDPSAATTAATTLAVPSTLATGATATPTTTAAIATAKKTGSKPPPAGKLPVGKKPIDVGY